MNEYVIFTDSGCDMDKDTLTDWGVSAKRLTFRFENEENEYSDGDIESKAFYDRMRNGAVAKTAAVNSQTFYDAFEEYLKKGIDVLHLGFSS